MISVNASAAAIKRRTIWGSFTSSVVAFLIIYFWGDRNPDWVAYMKIYDTGGAWLSASGRDSIFIFITRLFRAQPFLPTSYEAFRIVLALVFVIFSFRFMSGKVLYFPLRYTKFVFIAFLAFGFIRMTIQVREGLSVVLFFLACSILALPRAQRNRIRISRVLFAATFFYFSAGTHIAGIILFLVLIISMMTMTLSGRVGEIIQLVFTPFALAAFFLFSFATGVVDNGVLLAEGLSGKRNVDEGGISPSEFLVWSIFIVLNVSLWFSTFSPISSPTRQTAVLQIFSRNLAGPTAISGGVLVLVLKAAFVSPVVTVLIVRTAELSSMLAVLIVAILYGRRLGAITLTAFLLLKTLAPLNATGL